MRTHTSGTKSAFIRQYPDLPAREVVKRAAKKGLTITDHAVWQTRHHDKYKAARTEAKHRKSAKALEMPSDLSWLVKRAEACEREAQEQKDALASTEGLVLTAIRQERINRLTQLAQLYRAEAGALGVKIPA